MDLPTEVVGRSEARPAVESGACPGQDWVNEGRLAGEAGRGEVAAWFAPLAGWVVFLGAIQVLTLLLSVVKVPITHVVAKGILVASMLGCGMMFVAVRRAGVSGGGDGVAEPRSIYLRVLPWVVVLMATGAYVMGWLGAYYFRDTAGDGSMYHIPAVHFWRISRGVSWIDDGHWTSYWMNGFPKAVEVGAYIMVEALRDSHLVNCGNVLFMPLGVFGAASLARVLGASGGMAALAGAAWVLVPTNINQSVTSLVDTGYGSAAIAGIACLAYMYEGFHRRRSSNPWLGCIGFGTAAGLAIGAKSTGITVVGTGGVLLLLMLLCQRWRGRSAVAGISLRQLAGGFALAGILAIAVGGYWYVRNYVVKGSPIYPAGVTIGGHQIFPGFPFQKMTRNFDKAETPVEMRDWSTLAKALYNWTQLGFTTHWPETVWPWASRLGGLGSLWVLGCVPAMVGLVVRPARKSGADRSLFLLLGGVVFTGLLLTPMYWWARYTVWVYGLGLPCFAYAIGSKGSGSGAQESSRSMPRIMTKHWGVFCMVLLMVEAGYTGYRIWSICGPQLASYATSAARNEWKSYHYPHLNGTTMDRVFASREGIAVHLSGQQTITLGELCQPVGRRAIYPINVPIDTAKIGWLKEKRIRYVVWDYTSAVPPELERLASAIDRQYKFTILTLTLP